MELSCKCEYALLALMALVDHYQTGTPLQIRQIAEQQNIPDRYLEQLLCSLRRSGLVRSQRGAKGGYLLAKDPWQITVLEVLTCIEGRDLTATNPLSSLSTPEKLIVHEVWQQAHAASNAVWQDCTLQDLCDRRDAHQQSNLMYYI